jgi:hypothetical protein
LPYLSILYPTNLSSQSPKIQSWAKTLYEKQIDSTPLLKETRQIVFNDEGISGHHNLGRGTIKWNAFLEACETSDDFFFFTGKRTAQFVPKRAFNGEEQQDILRNLVRQKLQDKAKFLQ